VRLLIATDRDFWKADIGSRKRISNLCKYLSRQNLELYLFLSLGGRGLSQEEEAVLRENYCFSGIRVYEIRKPAGTATGKLRAFLGKLKKQDQRCVEPVLADFHDQCLKASFDIYAREICPEVVLVEYIRLAYLVDELPEQITTIIDTHDVMHLRYESFKSAGRPHWLKITREEEAAVLSRFDVVLAIQGAERTYLEALLGKEKSVIETGMDFDPVPLDEPQGEVITIGFVGSHDAQNVHGISFFIDKVWGALRLRTDKELVLAVAGSVGDILGRSASCPGIRLLGKVSDLEAFYRQATIVVNPVFIGGGLKIKSVEALSFGKPLVTTSTGARGLEDGAGLAYWCADTADQFVEKLLRLIESAEERAKLRDGARAYARENFAADVVYRDLLASIGL
jgi:glycosyltransferase involved in cell wall biosynthesis